MSYLDKGQSHHWLFKKSDKPVGFLAAVTSPYQTKGTIARPLVIDPACIPSMLGVASDWLNSLGKTSVQVVLPTAEKELIGRLQAEDWTVVQSWVRLVKYL